MEIPQSRPLLSSEGVKPGCTLHCYVVLLVGQYLDDMRRLELLVMNARAVGMLMNVHDSSGRIFQAFKYRLRLMARPFMLSRLPNARNLQQEELWIVGVELVNHPSFAKGDGFPHKK